MSTAAIKDSSVLSVTPQVACGEKASVDCAQTLTAVRRAFAKPQKEMRPLSSVVSAGTDIITDFSYLERLIPKLGVLDSTCGLTTGVNAFLGLDGAQRALVRASKAAEVGYAEGERTALLDAARCVSQTVGGAAYFGVRGLTLATQLKGVDATSASAPTLLGRVTFIVAAVSNAIWGLFYIFLAVVCGRDIRSAARLRTELLAACKPDKTPEKMSQGELLAYVRFFEKHAGLEIQKTDLEKHKAKCQLELATLVGNASAKELVQMTEKSVKAGELLSQRIEREDPEALEAARLFVRSNEELITEMETSLDANIRMNAGYVGACLIGIAATIASFFALNLVGLIVVTVAFFLMSTTMTVFDGYRFHKALDDIEPGKYDKTMLAISSVIGALSVGGGIAVVSILSMGIVPLIAAIAIGVVWIGMNAKIWHALNKHEAKAVRILTPKQQQEHNAWLRDILMGEFQEDPRRMGISEKEALACRVTEITPDMLAELEYTD